MGAGVFGDDNGAYYACAEGQKAGAARLRKIKDPTPLDYDVHDLMTYNAIAKKEGRPELTYGYWRRRESRQGHKSTDR